jgi:hypothetical protein
LRENHTSIEDKGASIVAIVPTDAVQIHEFVEVYGPYPFPIVGDPKQLAYKGMGHKHMPKLKLIWMSLEAFLSGKMKSSTPRSPYKRSIFIKAVRTQDIYQQGGTWLYSETGEVLWSHLDTDPADHATIDEIMSQLRKA